MSQLSIALENVSKRYTQRSVFKPVTCQSAPGEIIAVTGENGAGKSTLLKIVAGVLSPTKGKCDWKLGDRILDQEARRVRLGFAAPYLELYDELTAIEHVEFVLTLKGLKSARDAVRADLLSFGLSAEVIDSERHVRAYSSGMKQRVRLAIAFAGHPDAIFLDEPTANLDESGCSIVLDKARQAAARGAHLWIATNVEREREIAHRELHLESVT